MTIDTSPAAIAAVLEGVTEGRWTVSGPVYNQVIWSSAENRVAFMAHSNGLNDDRDIATARFISWCREGVPALAAERDKWEAGWAEAEGKLSDAQHTISTLQARVAELVGEYARGVNDAAGAVAQGWCLPDTSHIEMDVTLAQGIQAAIRALLTDGKGVE